MERVIFIPIIGSFSFPQRLDPEKSSSLPYWLYSAGRIIKLTEQGEEEAFYYLSLIIAHSRNERTGS
jgi:hypothetical protein